VTLLKSDRHAITAAIVVLEFGSVGRPVRSESAFKAIVRSAKLSDSVPRCGTGMGTAPCSAIGTRPRAMVKPRRSYFLVLSAAPSGCVSPVVIIFVAVPPAG
jgi:hypothetical protein